MVIIDVVINTILARLTLEPAGMHCPSWDDAFVSSIDFVSQHSAATTETHTNDIVKK